MLSKQRCVPESTTDTAMTRFVPICEKFAKGLINKDQCYQERDELVKSIRTQAFHLEFHSLPSATYKAAKWP